jgi:hypothetical protein
MKFECENPACKNAFEAPDQAKGTDVRCPLCGSAVRAAGAAAAIPPPLPGAAKPVVAPPPLPSSPKPGMAPPPLQSAPRPAAAPATSNLPSRADVPPYIAIPEITDPKLEIIPALEQFQSLHPGEQLVKNYQIRVRRPKFPWLAVTIALIPAVLTFVFSFIAARDREASTVFMVMSLVLLTVIGLIVVAFFLFRLRGHTFLYLTNQRVIVLELSEGIFSREQSVCHFSLDDICGFQLYAQRGLKKLFGLLLLKEKRTFYLGITTRTCCNVQIGAVNIRRSEFEPGRDAVALCGELDAKVLAMNLAHAH